MKLDRKYTNALAQIGLSIAVITAVLIGVYTNYAKEMGNKIQLKSRYTFTIRIDEDCNIVNEEDLENAKEVDEAYGYDSDEDKEIFTAPPIEKIGDVWIRAYISQYTQRFLSASKSLRNVDYSETKALDASDNTVLIEFSAKILDNNSEYFSSWDGIFDDGRLTCAWVVKFNVDDHMDNTATIYVGSMLTPEDYGIYQYNESIKENNQNTEENKNDKLTTYAIKDSTLYVSFNGGGSNVSVPVAVENLFTSVDDETKLREGSYMISTTKTAFLYGGSSSTGEKVPVTLIYTNNKGEEWITCEIKDIYTADYMYVEFFDENVGVIAIGYDKTDTSETCLIYSTTDGGLTWNEIGKGPANHIIKGVKFIDEKMGFICYEYVKGMESNIYITKDGGKTFSPVIFEAISQETMTEGSEDKTTEGYCDAQMPVVDDKGVITVDVGYIPGLDDDSAGSNTVVRYQSTDKGDTWKYIGQFDVGNSQS